MIIVNVLSTGNMILLIVQYHFLCCEPNIDYLQMYIFQSYFYPLYL